MKARHGRRWPWMLAAGLVVAGGTLSMAATGGVPALAPAWADLRRLATPWLVPAAGLAAVLTIGWLLVRARRRRGHGGRPLRDLSVNQLRQRLRTQVRRPDARERLLAQARARGLDERAALAWTLDKLERDRRTWK